MLWLSLSLLTACLSAARVILVKVSPARLKPLELAYVQYAYASPLLLLGACIAGIPPLTVKFWFAAVTAALLVASGTYCFFTAIRLADLSLVTPLRSITPALLLIVAPYTVGDTVSLLGALGIALIIWGVFTIDYRKGQTGALLESPGTKWTLLAIVLFAMCAQFEKYGIMLSSPSMFSAMECLIAALLLYLVKPRSNIASSLDVHTHWRYLMPLGMFFGCMMLAQSHAFSLGNISYTVAIKRLSTVITVLYGCMILGEAALPQRLLGCILMIGGAIAISISL